MSGGVKTSDETCTVPRIMNVSDMQGVPSARPTSHQLQLRGNGGGESITASALLLVAIS